MSRITWRIAFVVAALFAGVTADSRPADAHEYFTDGNVPNPLILGYRYLFVNVGSTITLTVKNGPGQTCDANIALAGFGDQISVTSPQKPGSVMTRDFKITGVSVGATNFDVTVDGVAPCIEHSHNLFSIVVLPAEAAFNRELSLASKSEGKLLGGALTTEWNAMRTTTAGVLRDLATAETQPGPAATSIFDAWYEAWANGYFRAQTTLRNLSAYGSGRLVAGGWPECTGPLGFGDGSRGAFDALRFDARNRLGAYQAKLDKQIGLDVAAFRKIASKLDVGFSLSYDLRPYPDLDVSGPTTSTRPADPAAPLYVGYGGAVSYTTPSGAATCVGFAGIADPTMGPIRVNLWDGDGMVGTKTFSPDGLGVWDVMFDDMKAGKTYRSDVQYVGGGGRDTTKIYAPQFRYDF